MCEITVIIFSQESFQPVQELHEHGCGMKVEVKLNLSEFGLHVYRALCMDSLFLFESFILRPSPHE